MRLCVSGGQKTASFRSDRLANRSSQQTGATSLTGSLAVLGAVSVSLILPLTARRKAAQPPRATSLVNGAGPAFNPTKQ
jgi:hypothetical protein